MKTVSIQLLMAALVLTVAGAGCANEKSSTTSPAAVEVDVPLPELNPSTLATDEAMAKRVIFMAYEEVNNQLGSFRFVAESRLKISHDDTVLHKQDDSYLVAQNANGDFHVELESPPISQANVTLIGDTVYIQHNWGRMRHKPRREDDHVEQWCEVGFTSLSQALGLFYTHLTLQSPTKAKVGKRSALRYKLGIGKGTRTNVSATPHVATKSLGLPISPRAKWRENARPTKLNGSIWVDSKTGVLLKAAFDGTLELPSDQEQMPNKMQLSYKSEMSRIAKPQSFGAPGKPVAEFKRSKPPRNVTSFYGKPAAPKADPAKK